MNNNLMFWVEWVKLTGEEKMRLLYHIHDDNILYEIAITDTHFGDESVREFIDEILYRIEDNSVVLKLASGLPPNCGDILVRRLNRMDLNELFSHYSTNICLMARAAMLAVIDHHLGDGNREHLTSLQSIMMTEPDTGLRDCIQSLLDRLTEDRI